MNENEVRAAFLKIETPQDFMAFKEQFPDARLDKEMALHLQEVASKYSTGDTREKHGDPRAAFTR